eukprot:3509184-Lingulodinium_polyedra.AAC.1
MSGAQGLLEAFPLAAAAAQPGPWSAAPPAAAWGPPGAAPGSTALQLDAQRGRALLGGDGGLPRLRR